MTGNLRHINNINNAMSQNDFATGEVKSAKTVKTEELPLVHESCKCSTFSLTVAAGALLVFAGIILYALIV